MAMFLSWIFLLIIIAVVVVIGVVLWSKLFGVDDAAARPGTAAGFADTAEAARHENESQIAVANRQAVAEGVLDRVEFSVVPRGYRPDQVDAVLAECQVEIARLRSQRHSTD